MFWYSPETLLKMSIIHKGKTVSQEVREKLRQANLGKKLSDERRRRMSEGRIGVPVLEPARKKIAFSKQGEKNWNTRLTEDDIHQIRKLFRRVSGYEIAEKFGISYTHVYNIGIRKVWKHI